MTRQTPRRELRQSQRSRFTFADTKKRYPAPRYFNALTWIVRICWIMVAMIACALFADYANATDYLSVQYRGQTVTVWGALDQMNIDGHNGGIAFTPTGATHVLHDNIMRDGMDTLRGTWTIVLPDREISASCYAAVSVLPDESIYTFDCVD